MKEINSTAKYALAVSGGVDSMVMLHKFATLCPRPDFFVVTINHGIRKEAASDCQFVADYCKSLLVECRVVNVDVPTYCAENKLSVETGARILRYQVLEGLDVDFVCLAHHADDNVETILMHILRGSGAKGATGIKSQNGKYLRPLLDLTRQEIEQYAIENNVPSVQDSTNDETKYTRNFIRHKVLPLLTKLNPNAKQNVLRFASNVQQDDEYLDTVADISTVIFDGKATIPNKLLLQPRPIAYRVLNKVFQRLGVFYDIEKTHYDAIISLAQNNGGTSVSLPFDYVAVNDYDFVTILPNATKIEAKQDFEIPFAVGRTVTPLGVVEVSEQATVGSLRFDIGKLGDNCVFRAKRQGDTFAKFGGGAKSLKKYLIDKKIPQRNRDSLLLVARDSDVLVICGVEIADSVKVEQGSKTYYIKLHGNG